MRSAGQISSKGRSHDGTSKLYFDAQTDRARRVLVKFVNRLPRPYGCAHTGRTHFVQQRRLAAIPAADVVGYSRLMGLDEAGTLAALKSVRRQLVDPKI